MSKHTPGPWVAIVPESRHIYNGTDITSFSVYTEKTRHKLSLEGLAHYREDRSDVDNVGIATNQYINDLTLDELVANAQLIAAAPELLEALKTSKLFFEAMIEDQRCGDMLIAAALTLDKINHVINKATGEQP